MRRRKIGRGKGRENGDVVEVVEGTWCICEVYSDIADIFVLLFIVLSM